MNHADLVKTIQFLRPDASFTVSGMDIIWGDESQIQPTEAEIQAGWIAYQAKVEADKAEAAAKKAAAQSKLEKLGLTFDDLKALDLARHILYRKCF